MDKKKNDSFLKREGIKIKYKYYAFISYSHIDKDWGNWLHKTLESYRIPASLKVQKSTEQKNILKLSPIFKDSEELPTHSNLSEVIIDALHKSRYLIVICSPSSAKSKWVNKEIIDFKRMHGESKVLALIVDGEPNAIDKTGYSESEEAFPEALKYKVDSSGNLTHERIELLAADAREKGEGKERAKIKLIAGLLGVGFDDLWQREKRRQKKHKIIWISIVILLFLIISTLSVISLIKWKEAEDQKTIAIKGREAAEDLIEHTLFDLRDKLDPIGKLDLLSSTYEAVDQYYKKLGNSNMSDDVYFRIAAYHTNNGDYFKRTGSLSKAEQHYEKALEIIKKLVKKKPKDSLLQRNYAIVYSELGTVMEAKGNDQRAFTYMLKAHRILKDQSSANPTNEQLKFELAKSYAKLGNIQRTQKNSSIVVKNFDTALQIMNTLIDGQNKNEQWLNDKAILHTTYGAYLSFLNMPKKALEQLQEALNIRKELIDRYPENYLYKYALSETYQYLGKLYLSKLHNMDEAKNFLQKAQKIMNELVKYDPTNTFWVNNLARGYDALGRLLMELNQVDQAISYYDKSIQILYQLILQDPDNISLKEEFALESSKLGDIYFERGEEGKAKKYLEKALIVMKNTSIEKTQHFRYQYILALIYNDLSHMYQTGFKNIDINNFYTNIETVRQKNKEYEKGVKFLMKSIKILKKLKKEDPSNPLWDMGGNNILEEANILNI